MLYAGFGHMVPRGLEPRTLRLLAVRSNQLSYETLRSQPLNNVRSVCGGKIWVDSGNGRQAGAENSREPKRAKNENPGGKKRKAANAGRGVRAGAVPVLGADVAACAPAAAARNKHRSPQAPPQQRAAHRCADPLSKASRGPLLPRQIRTPLWGPHVAGAPEQMQADCPCSKGARLGAE